MGQPAPDVDDAVHRADGRASRQDRHDDERTGRHGGEDHSADDRGQGEGGTDREIDPPREDHQELPDRQDRDHRRLGQDVARVASRQEDGREEAQDDDQPDESQQRPEPDDHEAPAQGREPVESTGTALRGNPRDRPGPTGFQPIRHRGSPACANVQPPVHVRSVQAPPRGLVRHRTYPLVIVGSWARCQL